MEIRQADWLAKEQNDLVVNACRQVLADLDESSGKARSQTPTG
jgi:hypothetical protein